MRVYQFTEQPYYPVWNDHNGSLRVNLPNRKLDPKIAGDLLHRYYDEWMLADELGLDIMLNEHHQTATCMSSTVIVTLAILARQTKKARLLVLGYPIGHRPHPPIWTTTGNRNQARLLGEKGYVMATLGSGYATRPLYDAYRQGYVATRRNAPGADRFAYLGLVAVADDEAEARRRGELVAGYLRSSSIVHVPFRNPPGFLSVEDNARMLKGQTAPRSFTKDGRVIDMHRASVQDLIDAGILFCGTPDQVYDQLVSFCEYCGGMGNLLMMGHAGFLSHEDTVSNLTIFAEEVLPRLKAYQQPQAEVTAA